MMVNDLVQQLAELMPGWSASEPHPDPLVTSARLRYDQRDGIELTLLHLALNDTIRVVPEYPHWYHSYVPLEEVRVFSADTSAEDIVTELQRVLPGYLERINAILDEAEAKQRQASAERAVTQMILQLTDGTLQHKTVVYGNTRVTTRVTGIKDDEPVLSVTFFEVPLNKALELLETAR